MSPLFVSQSSSASSNQAFFLASTEISLVKVTHNLHDVLHLHRPGNKLQHHDTENCVRNRNLQVKTIIYKLSSLQLLSAKSNYTLLNRNILFHKLPYYYNSFFVLLHYSLLCSRKLVSKFNMKSKSHSVVSNSLPPHGLYSPKNSPGQNTRVGSLSLLQGIFTTQGSNPGLPHCRLILYQLSHQGSPYTLLFITATYQSIIY